MSGQGDTMNGETPAERLSVEQIRAVAAEAVWLTRLARSSSWPLDMAQQVEMAGERVATTAPVLAERVIAAEAEVERLRSALEPFAAFHNRSMAARNPRMSDDLGVATIQNNVEGDVSITVGHLRAAVAALADEGGE